MEHQFYKIHIFLATFGLQFMLDSW